MTGEVEQREVGADSRVSLEELCRAAVDLSIRQGSATSTTLSQVTFFIHYQTSYILSLLSAEFPLQALNLTHSVSSIFLFSERNLTHIL